MGDAIGDGTDDDDAKWQYPDVLLEFEIAVQCDEDVADIPGVAQEFAILDAGPAQTVHGQDFMTVQMPCEIDGEILVKQQSHRR